MQKRSEKKEVSWFVGVIMFLGMSLLGIITFALVKETYKKNQVLAEIRKLQDDAVRVEKENSQIRAKLAYFDSRDFKEKEAKDKLNLQNPDENMVVIKPSLSRQAVAGEQDEKKEADKIPSNDFSSNPQKWFNYFFKY